jgi:hypothetical protein
MCALAMVGHLWERLALLAPGREALREALLRLAALAWLLGFFVAVEAALLKLIY